MSIKITEQHYKQFLNNDCQELVVDNEKYVFHEQLEKDMDENFSISTYILKRESDGKFFMITVTYVFAGYECYEFENYVQDNSLYECEEKEIVVKKWVLV